MVQKNIKKKPEIMAPAGDWTSLRAAVDAGCDAVFWGAKGINMRSGAKNFSVSELSRLVKFCHKNDVKTYLALNTIIYEKELPKIKALITKAKTAGVDAVICWDLSVIKEATKQKLPVFISTQMSVSNSESIIFFHKTFGVKRFVLARECSLEDIKTIRKDLKKILGARSSDIEIEVFAHGAMCVSISGRCFMSEYSFGRSANRGECIQPCRREYLVKDKDDGSEFILGEDYVMSPKDICTLPFIEKLIEAGVSSFKIEGRDRSPEYVGTVTSCYRKAVDHYFQNRRKKDFAKGFKELKKELLKDVERVYNRGFSSGFFLGRPIGEWTKTCGSQASTRKEYLGLIKNYYKRLKVAEVKLQTGELKKGDEIMFQGPTTGVVSQTAGSMEIEHKKVDAAEKGSLIAIKTEKPLRRNDKLYIVRKR